MKEFTIKRNKYLSRDIQAFYHTDYIGYKKEGNPDYLNTFKNSFNDYPNDIIREAKKQLLTHIEKDIYDIVNKHKELGVSLPLVISIVPRAKPRDRYHINQLQFIETIRELLQLIEILDNQINTIVDGCDYIIRYKDTKTTHLAKSGYGGEGSLPYPGIAKDTCNFSNEISGKDILLIDDIYTETINIDEDMIQALLDNGAKNVIFYSVGKTVYRQYKNGNIQI
jgi:amidophosphoribosyltransferase